MHRIHLKIRNRSREFRLLLGQIQNVLILLRRR